MFTFATDYYILVAVAATGTLQLAASLGRLDGLLFLKQPILARLLGLSLVVGAFVWFFAVEDRNINDYEGGLDAPTQALFFFLGSSSSLVFTLLASSLVNLGMRGGTDEPVEGLEALRRRNYADALARSIGHWLGKWRARTRSCSSG